VSRESPPWLSFSLFWSAAILRRRSLSFWIGQASEGCPLLLHGNPFIEKKRESGVSRRTPEQVQAF
jgi:hypothetical protein